MLTKRTIKAHHHSDIKLPVKFKITFNKPPSDTKNHEVTCRLILHEELQETAPLIFVHTKPNSQWVTFACQYKDLTKDSRLEITMGDLMTSTPLFNAEDLLVTDSHSIQDSGGHRIEVSSPPFRNPIIFREKSYSRSMIIHKDHRIYKVHDPNVPQQANPIAMMRKTLDAKQAHATEIKSETKEVIQQNRLLEYIQKKELGIVPPTATPLSLFAQFSRHMTAATFFYWYLLIQNIPLAKEFETKAVPQTMLKAFHHQRLFVTAIANATKQSQSVPRMAVLLDQDKMLRQITEPFPHPVRPDILITGINPHRCSIFKSERKPRLISFTTNSSAEFKAIYKSGDDLRQDQMIVQVITLMDSILRDNGLDLSLAKYHVLPTSETDGFVEFVSNSSTLSDILGKDKSISAFLKKHNTGLRPYLNALDTFVNSAAGYSLITYLLGIGDRHLENILITQSGQFFHIDFGFIFGIEPKGKKILSPQVRVTPEMLEVMGARFHHVFKKHVATAFFLLRKEIELILRLIPPSAHEFVNQRFHMDKTEEQAITIILDSMSEAADSFLPKVIDLSHDLASKMKHTPTDEKTERLPDKMLIKFGN